MPPPELMVSVEWTVQARGGGGCGERIHAPGRGLRWTVQRNGDHHTHKQCGRNHGNDHGKGYDNLIHSRTMYTFPPEYLVELNPQLEHD